MCYMIESLRRNTTQLSPYKPLVVDASRHKKHARARARNKINEPVGLAGCVCPCAPDWSERDAEAEATVVYWYG